MRCFRPTCLDHAPHGHHVVYEQELKRRWDSEPAVRERWSTWNRLYRDPRNIVDTCAFHHFGHHGRSRVIPLAELPDAAIEFAFELLGAFAFDYLRRRYSGDDPRLESHLAAAS